MRSICFKSSSQGCLSTFENDSSSIKNYVICNIYPITPELSAVVTVLQPATMFSRPHMCIFRLQ